MKKFFVLSSLIFFLMQAPAAFSEEFIDYVNSLNLTQEQYYQIQRIKNEEENILRPYVLDISAKENAVKLLKNMQCNRLDFDCKTKLKADIEQREFERDDILKKIEQKKLYYETRYKNILTRSQLLEIEETRQYEENKNKVLKEQEQNAKKQARIEKMKVWKKINLNSKNQNTKEKPPKKLKGDITGF